MKQGRWSLFPVSSNSWCTTLNQESHFVNLLSLSLSLFFSRGLSIFVFFYTTVSVYRRPSIFLPAWLFADEIDCGTKNTKADNKFLFTFFFFSISTVQKYYTKFTIQHRDIANFYLKNKILTCFHYFQLPMEFWFSELVWLAFSTSMNSISMIYFERYTYAWVWIINVPQALRPWLFFPPVDSHSMCFV